MKKFLFLGFAVAVIYLILKNRIRTSNSSPDFSKAGKAFADALVSKSSLGKNPADLLGMLEEMQSDPKIQEYLDFAMAHFPQMPTTEEKDGRIIARFGEDTFDITDLKDSLFVQGLKGEMQKGSQTA